MKDSLARRGIPIIWISVPIVSYIIHLISPSSIRERRPLSVAQLKVTITNSWFTELNTLFSSLSSVLNTSSSSPGHTPRSGSGMALISPLGIQFILLYNVEVSYHFPRKSPLSFTVREKECSVVWKARSKHWEMEETWPVISSVLAQRTICHPWAYRGCLEEFIWLASNHCPHHSLDCLLSHDNGVSMSK